MVEFVPRAAPRSALNQIGLSLPPAKAELEQRRRQYRQEQAEAQAAAQARLEHRRREEQEQRRLIQTKFQGCRTILVANPTADADHEYIDTVEAIAANPSRTTRGRASTVHDQPQPGLLLTGPSAAAPRT